MGAGRFIHLAGSSNGALPSPDLRVLSVTVSRWQQLVLLGRLAADKTTPHSVPPSVQVSTPPDELRADCSTALLCNRQVTATMRSSLIQDPLQLRRAPAASYTRRVLLCWASHMSPTHSSHSSVQARCSTRNATMRTGRLAVESAAVSTSCRAWRTCSQRGEGWGDRLETKLRAMHLRQLARAS